MNKIKKNILPFFFFFFLGSPVFWYACTPIRSPWELTAVNNNRGRDKIGERADIPSGSQLISVPPSFLFTSFHSPPVAALHEFMVVALKRVVFQSKEDTPVLLFE